MTAVADSHPRIKARREALRRTDERRKWIRTAIMLVLLLAAIAGLALVRTSLFDVDRVSVQGAAQVDTDVLVTLAGIEPGVALVDVDLDGVEHRVERHPWVASARARRDWPGTLHIDVVERVPVAATPIAQSTFLLVDLDGVVLDIVEQRPRTLPLVRGIAVDTAPGQVATGLNEAVKVVDAIPDDLARWVVAVDQQGEGNVVLELVDGIPAHLGTADRLADKLVALATLLTRVESACIESFNVAAPDAPVVTRCVQEPLHEG